MFRRLSWMSLALVFFIVSTDAFAHQVAENKPVNSEGVIFNVTLPFVGDVIVKRSNLPTWVLAALGSAGALIGVCKSWLTKKKATPTRVVSTNSTQFFSHFGPRRFEDDEKCGFACAASTFVRIKPVTRDDVLRRAKIVSAEARAKSKKMRRRMGIDDRERKPREALWRLMNEAGIPPTATGTMRYFQLPIYLENLETQLVSALRRGRRIYILGPGLDLGPNFSLSIPQLHELLAFFANDEVFIVDRNTWVRDALLLSEYDYETALRVIEYDPNLGPRAAELRQRLLALLARLPADLTNVQAIISAFEDLVIERNSADFIIATYSLIYALQRIPDPGERFKIIQRYLDALKINGVMLVDAMTFIYFVDKVPLLAEPTTMLIGTSHFRVFRLRSTTTKELRKKPHLFLDDDNSYVSTDDIIGMVKLD